MTCVGSGTPVKSKAESSVSMSHLHYVMDLYYPDGDRGDGLRRDILRIEAGGDDAALSEARRVSLWKAPSYYCLRSIRSSSRSGDLLIHDSRQENAPPEEQVIALGPASPCLPTARDTATPVNDGLDEAVIMPHSVQNRR
jgi:hypothetical protein